MWTVFCTALTASLLTWSGDDERIAELITALGDPAPSVVLQAIHELAELGPAAQEAVPHLVQLLRHGKEYSTIRFLATDALTAIRPARIEDLKVVLKEGDYQSRWLAAVVLGEAGPRAIEPLIDAIDDPHYMVGLNAVGSLGNMHATVALQAILSRLSDEDMEVRAAAADALGKFAIEPELCLSALIHSFEHDISPWVRFSAACAAANFGPDARRAIPSLAAAAQRRGATTRQITAMALADFKEHADDAVPILIRLLQDKDSDVRSAAAHSLGEIGPVNSEALVCLCNALHDAESQVRSNAAAAVGKTGPVGILAIPQLHQLLSDPDPITRDIARKAMLRIVLSVP